jgi:hypothetical protein
MIAHKEKDVATLIDSMPIDILNLIELRNYKYQLFSHQQHQVNKLRVKKNTAGWTC